MQKNVFHISDRHTDRLSAFRRLTYTEWGEAENPCVAVCVHGMTRNARDFDAFAEALDDSHRVFCIDLAGRGKSDWLREANGYMPATYISDIRRLLASLELVEVDWIGISLGGSLGMLISGDEGAVARSLVLDDIGPFLPASGMEPIAERVGRAPNFEDLEKAEEYQRQVCTEWGELDDETWMHLMLHSLRRHGDGGFTYHHDPAIGDALRAHGPMRDIELWQWWRRIECPVLALRGDKLKILPAETAAEMRQDGAEVIEYPGIGHTPPLMEAEQIAAVTDWLRT